MPRGRPTWAGDVVLTGSPTVLPSDSHSTWAETWNLFCALPLKSHCVCVGAGGGALEREVCLPEATPPRPAYGGIHSHQRGHRIPDFPLHHSVDIHCAPPYARHCSRLREWRAGVGHSCEQNGQKTSFGLPTSEENR